MPLNSGTAAEAGAFYEDALGRCRSLQQPRCVAEALNDNGIVAQSLGDFELALQRMTQAGDAWRLIGGDLREAETFSNLGVLFRRTGDFVRAIACTCGHGRNSPPGWTNGNVTVE